MTRRSTTAGIGLASALVGRVLCLATVIAGMTGCDTLKSWHRNNDDDGVPSSRSDDPYKPSAVQMDTSKIMGVTSDSNDSNNQKSFFSNTRRWSGFSSEARDIERDLGVY
jgi:hypothetical protein